MKPIGFIVVSSQIGVVGHNSSKNLLTIAFNMDKNGAYSIYEYENVDKILFEELILADSVGSFFHQHIKMTARVFRKISVSSDILLFFSELRAVSEFRNEFRNFRKIQPNAQDKINGNQVHINALWCW